jgi:tetratricopeptide (TPR) repeat protein
MIMFDRQQGLYNQQIDIEGVILDAELLVKYRFIDRAVASLEQAIQVFPKNLQLREKLCEICIDHNLIEKAAEQSIALSNIYAEAGDLDKANAVLVQAKNLNPNLTISPKPVTLKKSAPRPEAGSMNSTRSKVLTGDLSSINLFDVIQIIENSRLTGILTIEANNASGRIFFNYGQIADAKTSDASGTAAFRCFVDVCDGVFEMEKSPVEFKQNIDAPNNTNLILDLLREIDEERHDQMT